MRRVAALLAIVFATLCSGAGSAARAESDVPYWPSEQEERLKEVEKQSLDLQRKLFVTHMNQDGDAVKRLSKEFQSVQRERVQLLRATGKLPQN